jgi:hypothetical protein
LAKPRNVGVLTIRGKRREFLGSLPYDALWGLSINQMIATTEEAMSHAIDWWGDLPTSMKEAIDEFRVQLGAAIDSVEFVKRALDRSVPETSWKATEQR